MCIIFHIWYMAEPATLGPFAESISRAKYIPKEHTIGPYNGRASFSYDWECVYMCAFNTLRPRQNGRPFPDDIFKCICLNKVPLKFVPKGQINNIPALIQIMAWRHPDDKPLSDPMMASLLPHIPEYRKPFDHNDTTLSTRSFLCKGCAPLLMMYFTGMSHNFWCLRQVVLG